MQFTPTKTRLQGTQSHVSSLISSSNPLILEPGNTSLRSSVSSHFTIASSAATELRSVPRIGHQQILAVYNIEI